jgi:hypothetical protein
MSDAGQATVPQASKGLTELIGRALMDEKFRETLFADRTAAVKEYNLTQADQVALENLKREDLQQNAEVFGSVSAITIGIRISGSF